MTAVAIITGANKGIGRAIVEELVAQYHGSYMAKTMAAGGTEPTLLVYLTARDEGRGIAAVRELQPLAPAGTKIEFAQLDISSDSSIEALSKAMKEKHSTVDIMVNNAGIAMKGFDMNVVKTTLGTNYGGTKHMCEAFLPLMHPEHRRVVNVSSMAGKLGKLSGDLAQRFRAATTVPEVDALMAEFTHGVEQGTHEAKGWPSAAYSVSKMGVTGLTRALGGSSGVLINACCPGWVKTDMTAGTLTPKQGAQTPVFLALADLGGKSGVFWQNKKESAW